MPDLLAFFGRLHPLLLHLPIGILVGLAIMEAVAAKRGNGPTAPLLVRLAALVAALTATTGWLLHEEPGYADSFTLEWHERLGIATAACTIVCAILRSRGSVKHYRISLGLTVALLLPTGHFGAEMTHGAGFIFEPLFEGAGEPTEPPGAFANYGEHIAPLFAARCTTCHGPRKQKNGLRLDSPEFLLAGGEGGKVLRPGMPDKSALLYRLLLPLEDEDHMPPEYKAQPGPVEIELVRTWIAAGAPFEAPFELQDAGAMPRAPTAEEVDLLGPAPTHALLALRERFIHVEVVSAGTNALWIDYAAPAADIIDADVLDLLEPLENHVAELSLARTAITDAALAVLTDMDRLRRLDLRQTAVGDGGLAHLAGIESLAELVLVHTPVTDASIDTLLTLTGLQQLWTWNSDLSPEGIALLRAERPGLVLDTGEPPAAKALETEDDLVLTSDAPPVDDPDPGEALSAQNTECPISGQPVDPAYVVLFEGKLIGFCCENCPTQFWSDPELFRDKLP